MLSTSNRYLHVPTIHGGQSRQFGPAHWAWL